MARDILVVPASRYTIERVFSISEKLATWQRNRLHAEMISNSMIYKYALTKMKDPIPNTINDDVDLDTFPMPEREGEIPVEWIQDWWKLKLDKLPVGHESIR